MTREPVVIIVSLAALCAPLLTVLVAFGVPLTLAQVAAATTLVTALSGILARHFVSPVSDSSPNDGEI